MQGKYFPPEYAKNKFHCVHCGVYAAQFWSTINADGVRYRGNTGNIPIPVISNSVTHFNNEMPNEYVVSKCSHCNDYTVWYNKTIIFPRNATVELPNEDLNPDIQADYNEAARVLTDSPRAAAALLRLGLQKLCIQLGQKGKNINDDIAELVKGGLSPTIQKALDALRITGNNAVHPGEINLDEDPAKVVALFSLINFIAQKLLTEPKEIEALYDALPDDAKTAVEKRDKDA